MPEASGSREHPPGDAALSPAVFAASWRVVTVAGLLGMTYYRCCLIGAPNTRFLVELGATPFHFGLISGLGSLAMVCQLLSGLWANRVRRRKPWWMALFICHRLAFVGVLAAPGLFSSNATRIWWIIGVLLVHNALIHLGDPLWFSWMTDLVPKDRFSEQWGRRQRFITAGGMVAEIAIALWFGRYEAAGQVVHGFILLGTVGVILGIVDIVLFSLVPEPEHDRDERTTLRAALAEPFRNPEFRPFIVFEIYWQFAVGLAAPFFIVFLIRELQYTAFSVQVLLVLHGAGMALSSGLWGRLCDSHGFKPVLEVVVLLKFIVPLTYIVLPLVGKAAMPMLCAMFVLDGTLNGAGNLARRGFTLRCTPRRNRAMYVAAASFMAMGLAGGVAPLIAGTVIKPLTALLQDHSGAYHATGYHVVFLISCLLRAGGLPLVRRLREPSSRTMGEVFTAIRVTTGLFGIRSPQR